MMVMKKVWLTKFKIGRWRVPLFAVMPVLTGAALVVFLIASSYGFGVPLVWGFQTDRLPSAQIIESRGAEISPANTEFGKVESSFEGVGTDSSAPEKTGAAKPANRASGTPGKESQPRFGTTGQGGQSKSNNSDKHGQPGPGASGAGSIGQRKLPQEQSQLQSSVSNSNYQPESEVWNQEGWQLLISSVQEPVEGQTVKGVGWYYSDTLKEWRFHPGIDVLAKNGDYVRAALPGRVSSVEELVSGGSKVILEHQFGLSTIYVFGGKYKVKQGQEVEAGAVLGTIGLFDHLAEGMQPVLHFEARVNGEILHPSQFAPLVGKH